MKLLYLFITLSSISLSAQTTYEKGEKDQVIDNLRTQILSDSIKFNKNDLQFTVLGRKNLNCYGKLFCVDQKYLYKIDTIDNLLLRQFTKEILDEAKIESVVIVDQDKGSTLFGENICNGVVFVKMKKNIKYNPEVGDLKINKKGWGDNFSQRKVDEILIHN